MNKPPASVVFPADGNLHRLEIRLQAIQLSPYHAGPPDTPSQTTGPGRWVGCHALVPFAFRIQVSHSTQEPPSKSLPAEPGIQQAPRGAHGPLDDPADPAELGLVLDPAPCDAYFDPAAVQVGAAAAV